MQECNSAQCSVQDQECNSTSARMQQCKSAIVQEYSVLIARVLSARTRVQEQECKIKSARVQWELPVYDINASNSRRGVGPVHHCTQEIQKYKFIKIQNTKWQRMDFEWMHWISSYQTLHSPIPSFLCAASHFCSVQLLCFWWSWNALLRSSFMCSFVFLLKLFAFGDLEIPFLWSWHRTLGIPVKRGFSHQKEGKKVTRNAESTSLLQRIVGSLPQVTSAEVNA